MSQADLIPKNTPQPQKASSCGCGHDHHHAATASALQPTADASVADSANCSAAHLASSITRADGGESCLDQIQALVEGWSERPSWDEYFMATALLIASRSSCERLHVGCVLVSGGQNPNRIIAAGYNGFLSGHPHMSRVRDNHEQGTVHAEQNALADAARRGISVQGATAYVTHFPCIICTRLLLASGIKSVKYRFDYKNDPMALELWAEAGISVTQLH